MLKIPTISLYVYCMIDTGPKYTIHCKYSDYTIPQQCFYDYVLHQITIIYIFCGLYTKTYNVYKHQHPKFFTPLFPIRLSSFVNWILSAQFNFFFLCVIQLWYNILKLTNVLSTTNLISVVNISYMIRSCQNPTLKCE